MEFEWDEGKRRSNLQKHGVDFIRACRIFEGDVVEFEDTRYDYGEDRFIAIGETEGLLLTVVYADRHPVSRLISARKATQDERKIYDENYPR